MVVSLIDIYQASTDSFAKYLLPQSRCRYFGTPRAALGASGLASDSVEPPGESPTALDSEVGIMVCAGREIYESSASAGCTGRNQSLAGAPGGS